MDKLIPRINELAKKAKSEEGLTEEEKVEQAALRKEYIQLFRGNMKEQLMNVKVVDEDGKDITPKKLKKEQEKRKKN